MSKPSFSIIVPVYNVEEYIIECLESVAAQDYDGTVECIIVDDRGSDRSIELAQEFIDKYNGHIDFKIIVREQNGGQSATPNSVIRNSKNEYIIFLDSDDMLTPHSLSSFAKFISKYPEAQLIQGRAYQTVDKIHNTIYGTSNLPKLNEYYDNPIETLKALLLYDYFFIPVWSKAIKRDFIIDNNIFFREGILLEDNYWQLSIAHHLTRMAINNDDIIYIYRIHPNSSIRDDTNEKLRLESRLELIKYGLYEPSSIAPKIVYQVICQNIMYQYTLTRKNKLQYHQFKTLIYDFFKEKINSYRFPKKMISNFNLMLFRTIPPIKYNNFDSKPNNYISKLKNFFLYRISHFVLLKILSY